MPQLGFGVRDFLPQFSLSVEDLQSGGCDILFEIQSGGCDILFEIQSGGRDFFFVSGNFISESVGLFTRRYPTNTEGHEGYGPCDEALAANKRNYDGH